jgi:hypothetical protein
MSISYKFLGTAAWLALVAVAFSACGSDGSGPAAAQGGAGATGGQSSIGGGSGALAAAMSLNFVSGGTNCPIAVGYDDFPAVSGGHPVTASGAVATTTNNVTSPRGVVTATCTIAGSLLQANIAFAGGAEGMSFYVSRSGAAEGDLTYIPLNKGATYKGPTGALCSISALSTIATGGLYSVSCPTFSASDGTSCVLGQSYVYFEGCTLQ